MVKCRESRKNDVHVLISTDILISLRSNWKCFAFMPEFMRTLIRLDKFAQ